MPSKFGRHNYLLTLTSPLSEIVVKEEQTSRSCEKVFCLFEAPPKNPNPTTYRKDGIRSQHFKAQEQENAEMNQSIDSNNNIAKI
jgi:hypothetical protein